MQTQMEWPDAGVPASGSTGAGSDIFGMLWRRKWVVAFIAVLALPLGYMYFLRQQPVYQSSAQILLIKKESKEKLPLTGIEGQVSYEDALSTHMIILRSPWIISKAVEKHGLGSLPSLRGAPDPAGAIITELRASRAGGREMPDPNVIDLAYQGRDPSDCAAILNAVVQTYQDFLGETYQDFSEETVKLISEAKDVLHKQLADKEASYREFRQNAPILIKGKDGENVSLHEQRMGEIEAARSELLVSTAQTKSRIGAIERALENDVSRKALEMLIDNPLVSTSTDKPAANAFEPKVPRVADPLENDLFTTTLEEQLLLQDYGPDHPKVQVVRKKLSLIHDQLAENAKKRQQVAVEEEKLADEQTSAVEPEHIDLLATYLESLRQNIQIDQKQLAEYDALFEQEREAAKSLSSYLLADETHRNDIARTKQLYDTVVNRLEVISLAKDTGGIKTQLISPPQQGVQVAPKLLNIMLLFGMCGLVTGWGFGYLLEIADRSFRGPDDIRAHLALPIVGHIPVIDGREQKRAVKASGKAGALDSVLCTYFQPKGRCAEAYRAVRTALYFSSRSGGQKVIQITSPEPGDGKTTLAANLAVSIADSGKTVLLIEADFRRPRLHQLFGLGDSVGVSSVISGDTEITDGIHKTPVERLFVMPCGVRPDNPAELLTSPSFEHLIEITKTQYDFVIVDTPPILAVTDAAVVAPRVDATILVIRLGKRSREGALRAKDALQALNCNILGVVVNRYQQSAGYGYSAYQYGYGYGYGNNSYYLEEDTRKKALVKERSTLVLAGNRNGNHPRNGV